MSKKLQQLAFEWLGKRETMNLEHWVEGVRTTFPDLKSALRDELFFALECLSRGIPLTDRAWQIGDPIHEWIQRMKNPLLSYSGMDDHLNAFMTDFSLQKAGQAHPAMVVGDGTPVLNMDIYQVKSYFGFFAEMGLPRATLSRILDHAYPPQEFSLMDLEESYGSWVNSRCNSADDRLQVRAYLNVFVWSFRHTSAAMVFPGGVTHRYGKFPEIVCFYAAYHVLYFMQRGLTHTKLATLWEDYEPLA